MFDLIIHSESRVINTNIDTFKTQALYFLENGLHQHFETDEDFLKVDEDVKALKKAEEKINATIHAVMNGNQEIKKVIETATEVCELIRQERLQREKLVKQRKESIKADLINEAIKEVNNFLNNLNENSHVLTALWDLFPVEELQEKLNQEIKGKKTIDGAMKAINAVKHLYLVQIASKHAYLKERLASFPTSHAYLFPDIFELIKGDDDINLIIQERMKAEEERQKNNALNKGEVEAPFPPNVTNRQAPHHEDNEAVFNFELSIPFRGTEEQAKAYFAPIKKLSYEGIRLVKLK